MFQKLTKKCDFPKEAERGIIGQNLKIISKEFHFSLRCNCVHVIGGCQRCEGMSEKSPTEK